MMQTASSPTIQETAPSAQTPALRFSWREGIKFVAHMIATILVSPLLLTWWVESLLIGKDRALIYATETLALLPGLTGRYVRRAFLARVLAHCSWKTEIGFGVIFSKVGARVEDNVYIGPRCHIGLAVIERDVLIAAGTQITSGGRMHGIDDLSKPIREQEGVYTLVRIGAGAWIGGGAVVMADVGSDSVVGAGAIVTKALPEKVIAAGIPAKVIRHRDGSLPNSTL